MLQRILIGLICTFSLPVHGFAQGAIFLVRHAERADTGTGTPPMMATDPDLSEAGRARATSLAAMLKDAGVSAIFVTEFKRTQQTAAPLAKALGITPTVVPAKDASGLAGRLKKARGNLLVVGHSNTIPEVIAAIGVAEPVSIGDTEFDKLFIVHTVPVARAIQLHYR